MITYKRVVKDLLLHMFVYTIIIASLSFVFSMKLQNDLLNQLTLIVLGAICGDAIKCIVSGWRQWRKAKREDTEWRDMKRYAGEIDVFSAGGFRVDDMRVYALCTESKPYTDFKRVDFKLEWAEERPLPKEWAVIEATVLPRLRDEAEKHGVVFSDGPQVDMKRASIDRDRERRPTEPNRINVEVAPTSYFPFAAMSNRLDEKVDGLAPSPTTLRQLWTGDQPIGLLDVEKLQSPAKIGTVTVIVTADNFLLVHARSAQVHQVSGVPRPGESDLRTGVHFVGEGMLPTDCRPHQPLDPRETAIRALQEEVGLDPSIINDIKIMPTAFVFDTKRWQPVFCYIAEVPISFSELEAGIPIAKDSFEALVFRCLPFDVDDQEVRQLLLKKHEKWHLSSNHASIALYAALVWHHGPAKVSQALNKSDNSIKAHAVSWSKRVSTLLNKASVARLKQGV